MSVRKATNSAEVCRSRSSQDLTGLGVEGCVERERAVTEVLKTMTLGPTRGERQNRILAIQGLNMGLFVNAEHRRVGRRGFRYRPMISAASSQVRIVRGHVSARSDGLKAVLAPHSRDIMWLIPALGELARRPSVECLRMSGALQDPGFQLRGKHRCDLADVSG